MFVPHLFSYSLVQFKLSLLHTRELNRQNYGPTSLNKDMCYTVGVDVQEHGSAATLGLVLYLGVQPAP